MSMPVIILLVVLFIAVLIVLLLVSGKGKNKKHPKRHKRAHLNKFCVATSDCLTGLTCSDGRCLIPQGGSCGDQKFYCENGSICSPQGVCIDNTDSPRNIESKSSDYTSKGDSNESTPSFTEKIFTQLLVVDNGSAFKIYEGSYYDATRNNDIIVVYDVSNIVFMKVSYDTGKVVCASKNVACNALESNPKYIKISSTGSHLYVLTHEHILYKADISGITFDGTLQNITFKHFETPFTPIALGSSLCGGVLVLGEEGRHFTIKNGVKDTSSVSMIDSNAKYATYIKGKLFTVSEVSGNHYFEYDSNITVYDGNGIVNCVDGEIITSSYVIKEGLLLKP